MKTKLIFIISLSAFLLPAVALADFSASASSSTPNSITAPTIAASSTPNSSASTTPLNLQAPAIPPLIAQIDQAKALLSTVKLNYAISAIYKNVKNKKTKKTTKTLTGYNLWAKDIALAILDPATGQISTTLGMQTGKTIKFSDPAFDIKLTYFNGVNSKFQINKPAGGTVLALKYLFTGPETGSKASIVSALYDGMYVPYSDSLNSPDVIAYGQQYITGIISRVAADLANFPASSVPGKTIPQAISPSLIRALVYAEHTDTASVLNGNVADTINQLNILFATNQGDAYKYSVSTASARGIAQFIPSTYASLVARHPEANLIPDFAAAMSDHYNSIKAMYLLIDDYAGDVRVRAQNGFAEGQVFDYGAASYNGGTTRVAKAVNTLGQNWNQDQSAQINALQAQVNSLKSQIKKASKKNKPALQAQYNSVADELANLKAAALKNETVNYLQKIYKVIPYFNSQQI